MQPTTSSESTSPLQPLVEALVNFHKTVPAINKTATAQYGKFADLATVLSTVTPHLIKNGLAVSQGFEPSSHDNNPVLVTQLLHVSGSQLVSRLPMVVGGRGKNPLHDFGGSVSYSRRYSLLAILGLTADMDVDGDFADLAEPAPAKPAAKIEGVADKDQPLSKEDRELCLGLIQELSADNLARFCKDFRRDFGLASDAKIAPVLTGVKHQNWMNANLKNYV
tara:strand:+ start:614 stop:1279 length:666 start_codon:yes stop_codon:yes gene_type:complete